eukprot:TRINITY_DN102073_c0_g1_i1.p1 TRINITY_DN102073_c0_g1~~TRINITY_DN102073_c0_g1_i1.p1  ORF type:complete len:524 (-),score=106.85 TRINITY_DN102073_c0_g1_i1:49-1578(-)
MSTAPAVPMPPPDVPPPAWSSRTTKPVCRYGSACARKNPRHFLDFAHAASGSSSSSTPAAAATPKSLPMARPRTEGAAPKRCKFGCGRPPNRTGSKVFNTCCRQCGICQGAGDHDESCAGGRAARPKTSSVGGSRPSEAAAFITADLALELRRRAHACQAAGDSEAAESLFADSLEGLQAAKAKAPAGGTAAKLIERVLYALDTKSGDAESNRVFETEVDLELERLIAELDAATSAAKAAKSGTSVVALCKFGCKRHVNAGLTKEGKPFDTCCRTCASSRGAGSHDASCTGGSVASTSEIALIQTEVSAYTGDGSMPVREDKEAVRAALRALGLNDEWPPALTSREVRRRYMREALACHPDKGPAEEFETRTARFQEVSAAYALLEVEFAYLEEATSGEGTTVGTRSEAKGGYAELEDAPAGSAGPPTQSLASDISALALPPPPSTYRSNGVSESEAKPVKSVSSISVLSSLFFGCAQEPLLEKDDVVETTGGPPRPLWSKSRWDIDLF